MASRQQSSIDITKSISRVEASRPNLVIGDSDGMGLSTSLFCSGHDSSDAIGPETFTQVGHSSTKNICGILAKTMCVVNQKTSLLINGLNGWNQV
jgi:hypothetical protein